MLKNDYSKDFQHICSPTPLLQQQSTNSLCQMMMQRTLSSALRRATSTSDATQKSTSSPSLPRVFTRNIFVIIQKGEEGQRLFLGSNPQKLEPGVRVAIPFFHNVRRVDMRERRISVNNLDSYAKDGVAVTLDGTLFFQVVNSHNAVFNVDDYVAAVDSLGVSAARSIIGNFDFDELTSSRWKINDALRESIERDERINRWGIKCLRFEVQDVRPQNENVRNQLSLQMEAERKRRENDLNTTASIRTAEGQKAAAILKSEGQRTAAENMAEASYVAVTREADAQKYRIEAEAEAQAIEIRKIAATLSDDAYGAARFIVEMRRIKQLQAIASGPNNTVYVVPADVVAAASTAAQALSGLVNHSRVPPS